MTNDNTYHWNPFLDLLYLEVLKFIVNHGGIVLKEDRNYTTFLEVNNSFRYQVSLSTYSHIKLITDVKVQFNQ